MKPDAVRTDLIECLILFFVFFNPVSALAFPGSADFSSPAYHFAYWAQALPQIALLVWLDRGRGAMRLGVRGAGIVSLAGRSIALGIAAFALAAAVMLLWMLPARFAGSESAVSGAFAVPLRPGVLILAFPTAVLTGYREELFFRAKLIPGLEEAGFAPWAPLVSAALFAFLHLGRGWMPCLVALTVGLVFGYRFRSRRDPHEISLGHAFYDMAVIVLGLA